MIDASSVHSDTHHWKHGNDKTNSYNRKYKPSFNNSNNNNDNNDSSGGGGDVDDNDDGGSEDDNDKTGCVSWNTSTPPLLQQCHLGHKVKLTKWSALMFSENA